MSSAIRVKAMCLLVQEGFLLVEDGETIHSDTLPIVPGNFHRILGGTMNFGESAEEAVRREIREEMQSEIENLEFLDVIENRYTYAGHQGHEIVFMFKGNLKEKFDTSKKIHIVEDGYEFDAVWIPLDEAFSGPKPLFPVFNYKKYFS